jgi:signal transduction histidine kinase/predicted ATPase/tRNA A-37 threonylcarbamoyl transferase component Bud32
MVIAKVFDIEDEADEDRVQHEFELIRGLDIEGVVQALELRRIGDQLVLLLERVAGDDLAEFADGRPLALDSFWLIATQIADILARTHAAGVIHRDIKPTNILIDDARERVCLADFGVSVLLENDRRHIYDSDVFVGTLPYISPEQTGRTGHVVDFRSDLYSLGVTFYELLAGRRPFEGMTPLELIHAHLAHRPEALARVRADIPEGLSRLIMRLLAKAPEHRYQTAAGLASDLRQLRELAEAGRGTERFELGSADLSITLRLPHQLYGHARERAELAHALTSVAGSGTRQTLALIGGAGIGKSALIAELEASVAGHGGYMVRGEFGVQGEQPYSGFTQAFTALFEQLLTESDARLERWRRLLIDGLGNLVGVLAEFAPRLELIVGRHPVPGQLDVAEGRNRLVVAIERLLAVVCSVGGPLVLVLEDLQRAEQGSLQLVGALAHGQRGPLLMLVSLRADELDAEHPLAKALTDLEGHARYARLELAPLANEDIEALLADALPGASELDVLARTIHRKTNGVPLFIRQLLTQLAEKGLLRASGRAWQWDAEGVEAEPIPDDAVAMTSAKLESLSPAARELIRCASCVGSHFDLRRLARVSERERSEITASLLELEDAGLVGRVGGGYRFAHDSIRAAAQLGLDPDTRRRLHWTLAEELRASLGESDEHLFEVIDHCHAGAPEHLDDSLRLELATLDLRAGKRALDAAAYDLAHNYLAHGIALTAESCGEASTRGPKARGYELCFQLQFSFAYTLALAGRRRQADAAFVELLAWPLEDRHYAQVVCRRIDLLWIEARHTESMELGIAALARLGSPIPESLERGDAIACVERAWREFREFDDVAIQAMPRCEDEREAAVIDVVAALKYPAFAFDILFLYLIGLHAELLARHGYHPTTAKALADLAIGVNGSLGRVAEGVRLLELGRELARQEPRGSSEPRLLAIAGNLTMHRGRPFAEVIASFDAGYLQAVESGEFDAASFLGGFGTDMQLEVGTHLRVLDRRSRRVIRDVGRGSSNQMRVEVYMLRGLCRALIGAELEPDDEVEIWDLDPEQVFAHGGARTNYYVAHLIKAMIELLLDDPAALDTCLRIIHDVDQITFNTFYLARAHVLTCAAYHVRALAGGPMPEGAALAVGKSLQLLERWAADCPANYGHYLALALGLHHALAADHSRAATLLDEAWQGARRQGCRWIEGLAAEQLAALFERQGLLAPIAGLRERAWDAYEAWGADAKLMHMRAAHPNSFDELGRHEPSSSDRRRQGRSTPEFTNSRMASTPPLDLARVLRSVGTITEDLRLEEVIRRLLDAALTNVGADHGLLVLDQDGELTLVAEASVDECSVFADPLLLRDASLRAPATLIHFVSRMGQSVVLDDAREDLRFAGDPYLERTEVRSALALPLVKGERRLGVLVLENHLTTRGFGATSLEVLRLITNQAVSTLENAQLYSALRRSEARWRSLVDGAPDLIALLDENGAIVFRNHSGPLRGIDERDEDGALRPESAQRWREAVETVLREGRRCELELEFVPLSGPERWYAVRLAPIELHRALSGEADTVHRNAVAVATNISAQKQAEAEKRMLEAQLRQQQRLESVGTLASGVAHEINNPIQGIMNYAELIYASAPERALVEDFASEITRESRRVAKIVRNLLAFSRQDASEEPEPVQLAEIVDSSLSLVRAVLRGDHIIVEVTVDPDLPPVLCRAQQIQQVVMNLVTNARDALNERYGAYDDRKRVDIRIGLAPRIDWVRVTVRDSGSGIPADVLPRIFDPFFTTKGRDQGTGLGLAVSHGIVQEHGGEFTVETEPGVGTCFSLDLPAFGV